MTAQISDPFEYQGETYALIGIRGGDLPTPQQFGLKPNSYCTGCYRGYFADYERKADRLVLLSLSLFPVNDCLPPVQGITPKKGLNFYTYQGLNLTVNFTGKIRLARDFIQKYYVHMGFQKASAFKTVLDITLKAGRILEIKDRSQEMEQKRGAFKTHFLSEEAMLAIAEAFSLDLDLE